MARAVESPPLECASSEDTGSALASKASSPLQPPIAAGAAAAADETQRKRLRHREYVKKSYQKKITTIATLKKELDALELQYNAVLAGRRGADAPLDPVIKTEHGEPPPLPLLSRYVELANLKAQYQKENAELYELNAEFMKIEGRVQQLVDAEAQLPDVLQRMEAPSLPPPSPRFHFQSLPDAAYAQLIASARDDILEFAYDTDKLSSGSRVFGWTDQRKIAGDELKFALEKSFPSISAYDLLARSWSIFSSPTRFAQIYSSSLHLAFHELQHINDDTRLFFRTVQVDGSDKIAKTVFLLARLRIERGYMVLFRAIDASLVRFRESASGYVAHETMRALATGSELPKEVWVDKYSWVIFQETGPSSSLFHFGGSTLTNLWLKEVLFIALRWETLAVGPQITLEM